MGISTRNKAMKAILGRKIGMSQTFSPEGEVIPVTLIAAETNIVALRRTMEKDGYSAVQLALPKQVKKSEKKSDSKKEVEFAAKMEFKSEELPEAAELTVEQFVVGDMVEVIGTSKG